MSICKKVILANYLYDIAKSSKSEIIEVAKDDELAKIAEKKGIIVPSMDIAILKTRYAKFDEPNRNKIALPKKAAIKALPSIIGKNANWSHKGKNYLCGFILDAKIEDEYIVTYIVIYKSLFFDEYEKMKEMVKENKMAVSFEIWSVSEKGESVLHDLGDGNYSIDPIIYHGVGILIEGETPACKEAYADKLLAMKNDRLIQEAEKIANTQRDENLIYASLSIEKSECKHCEKCICGGEEMDEVKKEENVEQKPIETSVEQVKEEKTEIISEPKTVETPKTEVATEETKVEATAPAAETKPVEEPKVEETPKVEGEEKKEVKEPEKAQEMEVIEPKVIVKVTRMYSDIFVDTYVDGTLNGTSEGESKFKKVTEYKDGTKDEIEEDSKYVKKYDFAELEKAINEAKVAKDAEIATLKAEQEKVVKEKEEKIEAQTKELGQKDQEIAKLTKPVETAMEKKPEMSVGNVEKAEEESEDKKGAKEIDALIARKHQR